MFLINLALQARESFADWRRKRRAYEELMALDDRMLADIGIHRSEISRIVWGGPESGEDSFEDRRRCPDFSTDTQCESPLPWPLPRPF